MGDQAYALTNKARQDFQGGALTQTGAGSESGAAGTGAPTPSNGFGLAKAAGEDNDAYAKNYASDNAIY